MKIQIIHGPNLNLLGTRQPEVYGHQNFEAFYRQLCAKYEDIRFSYFQSNVEGELVTAIQQAEGMDYLLLNAAAYTHTSIAIADAVAAINTPTIGLHLSNIYTREKERHIDLLAKYCEACLFGFGLKGYELATEYALEKMNNREYGK